MPLDVEWRVVSVNVAKFAGKDVQLKSCNQAKDGAWQFGCFGGIWME